MRTRKLKPLLVQLSILMALLLISSIGVVPLQASAPETQCFDIITNLQGSATWTSDGAVDSSGTATYTTSLAGWDPKLNIPATVHHFFTLTDTEGTITMRVDAKSALVEDSSGTEVRGYTVNWTILSGTGAYSSLHSQGDGYGWPDFTSFTLPIYMCGQAHFDPQS